MREQVDGLDGLDGVRSGLEERCQVAGLRLRVTAHVHDPLRPQVRDLADHLGVHPGARRVHDQDVGPTVLLDQLRPEQLEHVAGHELAVADAVGLGTRPRVLNRLLDQLHSDDALDGIGDEEGDRAGAAVKIVDDVGRLEVGELLSDGVEPLGSDGVGLEKGVRGDLERVLAQPVPDGARTEHGVRGLPKRRLRDARVDRVDEGRDLGKLGLEEGLERLHPLRQVMRRDQVDHLVLRVRRRADGQDAEVASVLAGMPRRPAVLLRERADAVDQPRAPLALEVAGLEVEDLVKPAGHMEPERKVGVEFFSGRDLPVGQPALGREGELHLVAVEVRPAGAVAVLGTEWRAEVGALEVEPGARER